MAEQLKGRRVAALVADGFEEVELTQPRRALEAAGATVEVVSPEKDQVRGWNRTDWGTSVGVDRSTPRAPTTTTRCCCPAAS